MSRITALPAFLFIICLISTGRHVMASQSVTPYDEKSAVIFAYNRIGEDGFPETNLRTSLFKAHIRELLTGDYNVLPLPQIVDALKHGKNLPPRTVGITFDGGHRSVLDTAVPLLLKNDLPFTVFTSTDKADLNLSRYMNWSDLKKLKKSRVVTIGIHPASYTRLTGSGKEDILRQINKAKTIYRENLGEAPKLFAYPFGEYSLTYHDIVKANGFEAAFGQQSGVSWPGSDMFALPRFTMTDSVAGLERFRLTANALPLPVKDTEPQDPCLREDSPVIGFTLHESLKEDAGALLCFSSAQEDPVYEIIGSRIELRHEHPLNQSRIRINCTLPGPLPEGGSGPDNPPRWRWLGMLLNMPVNYYQDTIE